jgi:exopolysaccharide production protein ExoZ
MQTLLSIQYLRAIAAIAVVVSHCWPKAVLAQGGVDIFFVISGFIMWTLTAKPVGLAPFWWQRLVRIAPLYWSVTAIMAVHLHAPLPLIAKSMLFWPYFGEGGHIWPILVVGWTLNYEIGFYALIGVLLFLRRRQALIVLIVALCCLSILHPFVKPENAPALTYTNPIILEFAAGTLLAELQLRNHLPRPLWAIPMVCGAALIVWLFAPSVVPDGCERLLVWGVPGALIVTSAVLCEAGGRMVRVPTLKTLGDASYAIYLLHPLVVRVILEQLTNFPVVLQIMTATSAAALLGVLAHFSFEQPLTQTLRRLGTWLQRPQVPRSVP